MCQKVSITAERPYVSYWYKIDSDAPLCDISSGFGYDYGSVGGSIPEGGGAHDFIVLCDQTDTNGQWIRRVADFRSFIGRDIELNLQVVNQSYFPSAMHFDDIELVAAP